MFSELKLAELLCTRLCHDLTGPIGAVNNGAEFLEEEGFDMQNEAMQLVLNSASEAVHRLQFYRQAYGRINDHGEACLEEKRQIIEDFFSSTRIKIDWPDAHLGSGTVSVSHKLARLILNLLIIASGILIKGGTVAIRMSEKPGASRRVSLDLTGPMIKMDDDILRVLRRESELSNLTPKTAQLALTLKLADEIGVALTFNLDAEHCLIEAEQALVEEAVPAHSFA